jgi:hypothetical protein
MQNETNELNWGTLPTNNPSELTPYFKVKQGDNIIRVISNPILNKRTHYLKASNRFEVCTAPHCLICDAEKPTGKSTSRPEYKCYIIDRDDNDTIKTFTFGTQVASSMGKLFTMEEQLTEVGPYNAYDIKLTKGKAMNGQISYEVFAPNLPKYLKPLSSDLQEAIAVLPALKPATVEVVEKHSDDFENLPF